jgi:hypothetical protein
MWFLFEPSLKWFGVGDGVGADGGGLAVDGGAFDEPAGGLAIVRWSPLSALASAIE